MFGFFKKNKENMKAQSMITTGCEIKKEKI